MALSKRKRCFLLFTMLISLFTVNCSLFAVTASANSVSITDDYDVLSLGVPVSLQGKSAMSDFILNSPNVYYYDLENETPSWIEKNSTLNDQFSIQYNSTNTGAADLYIFPSFTNTCIDSLRSSVPILVSSKEDSRSNFDVVLGIGDATDFNGLSIDSLDIFYDISYIDVTMSSDGVTHFGYASYGVQRTISRNGNWFYVPLLDNALTSGFFNETKGFVDDSGVSYTWILQANVYIRTDYWSDYYYLDPFSASANKPLSDYEYMLDRRVISILDSDMVQISFNDVSWTDWLVTSVGSFMNFEIVPGLTLSGILGLLIGMSLFMVFLKVFAGG